MPATASRNNESAIEQVNTELLSWKMPLPQVGDRVIWFQGTGTNHARGCVAIVSHVDPNYAELVTLGQNQHLQCKKQARHVSDPRLAIGDDWTVYGTWDFLPPSETDRLLLAEIAAMRKVFTVLEQKVARCEDQIIELLKENTEIKKRLSQQAKGGPTLPQSAKAEGK